MGLNLAYSLKVAINTGSKSPLLTCNPCTIAPFACKKAFSGMVNAAANSGFKRGRWQRWWKNNNLFLLRRRRQLPFLLALHISEFPVSITKQCSASGPSRGGFKESQYRAQKNSLFCHILCRTCRHLCPKQLGRNNFICVQKIPSGFVIILPGRNKVCQCN